MEVSVFERIRGSLLQKRQYLTGWLRATPADKKAARLGPATEQAVQTHLHVIETALEKTANQTLGLCQVCHEYVESSLLEMDYTSCVCLDHLSGEEKRRLEAELELSQVVQRALLPQQVPDIPGLELAVFSRPAQIVSGDYFDFFRYRDGAFGLAIADVAGHGVSASLLMASLQTSLRTLAPEHDSPAEILQRLNRFFHHNIHVTTFVTVFLARFDPAARNLVYSNAGHNPPLLVRAAAPLQESVAWLSPTAAAVGLVEEFQEATETVPLDAGDVLLLYTDGLTEATNGQQQEFGPERLAALARQHRQLPVKDFVHSLRHTLHQYTGHESVADDTTVIAAKVVELA